MRFLLIGILIAGSATAADRVMESVLGSLGYGSGCVSIIRIRNLSERIVAVEVEGHRESGALVPVVGLAGNTLQLPARSSGEYQLDIDEATDSAWVKIRERIADVGLSPALAITASLDCRVANRLETTSRRLTHPVRNPWFSGEVAGIEGNMVSLINTGESAIRVKGCYSAGSLYSAGGAELEPVCSNSIDVQVPPYGSRRFPVSSDGNTRFSLHVRGEHVVLEMMRPSEASRRIYAVDSDIHFGEEAPAVSK